MQAESGSPGATAEQGEAITEVGATGRDAALSPEGGAGTGCYVLDLQEVGPAQVAIVGGKGAHLGELARVEGIRVPPGFCVTTEAFGRIMAEACAHDDRHGDRVDRLARLEPDNQEALRTLSTEIRRTLETVAIPEDLAAAILGALARPGAIARLGAQAAYAVRSSATAEDSPSTSFAGQHDTYLNVVGPEAILEHVRRCWASLFTERAVTYRLKNGFDHRKVQMAVVVQQMVFPQASGILFTADPVTGNRKAAAVEATLGLGESLVSGAVNADVYKVREGEVVARTIASKHLAVHALPTGGIEERSLAPELQELPTLTDAQVLQLVQLGRQIEAHFGCPQDIEWCLTDEGVEIVQSRPITTLFPVPAVADGQNHVYVSVGHAQMMTDPMKPLGISLWQLTALRPMFEAGGRLFVDVAGGLASPASRAGLLATLGKGDPLVGDALRTILERGDVIRSLPDEGPGTPPAGGLAARGASAGSAPALLEADPAIVAGLIERNQASLAALERDIRAKTGSALLDFILADLQELKRLLADPQSSQVIRAAMEATWWLNEHLQDWLGELNAADTLAQSAPHNVTSDMGLALLDVADAIRPHPEVVAFLQNVSGEGFLDELARVPGGLEARAAIRAYLDRYGMRCVGEIDITRPRWGERPSALVPMILSHVNTFEPGEGTRRFERGRQEASKKEREILERLSALPDGERKAQEAKGMIDRVRTFIGYREYPKYGMISRYYLYKQALLTEAERLVQANVVREREDIFYLTFQELQDAVRTNQVEDQVIRQRMEAFRAYQALTPPRVITSDGEVVCGTYRRDPLPDRALVGLAVSSGTVEGRARVIRDLAEADLEPGDILVTAYTDPSWTPLFLGIKGLVTEVGGLMTHGAVIAREYGLPAVVGVERATGLIQDGQRIRVHGTEGFVEILSSVT